MVNTEQASRGSHRWILRCDGCIALNLEQGEFTIHTCMYMIYVEGVAAAVPVGLSLGVVCEEDSGRLLHVVVGLRNGSGMYPCLAICSCPKAVKIFPWTKMASSASLSITRPSAASRIVVSQSPPPIPAFFFLKKKIPLSLALYKPPTPPATLIVQKKLSICRLCHLNLLLP